MNLLSKTLGRFCLSLVLPSFWVVASIAAAVVGQAAAIPWENGQAAEVTLSGLGFPYAVAIDGAHAKLYVAELGNNRVLRFAYPLTSSGDSAEMVFGQADLAGTSANRGNASPSAKSLNSPQGITVSSTGDLWIADAGNNRVVKIPSAYNAVPDVAATVVLGQTGFVSADTGASASGLSGPKAVVWDAAGNLWVLDGGNNRVLRFANAASISAPGGIPASGALGGYGSASATTLSGPYGLCISGTTLWVADYNNNRVLQYKNAASKSDGAPADGVLGQTSFTGSGMGSLSSSSLWSPSGVATDASGRLYVSENSSGRVIIYSNPNTAAQLPGGPGDGVLYTDSFTASGIGNAPWGLAYDDTYHRLVVPSVGGGFVTQFNNLYNTTTTLASSPNPSTTTGATVTLTATVSTAAGGPTATGTVNFKEGTTVIGSDTLNGLGVATFATNSFADGNHVIVAEYLQSGVNRGSTSSALTQVIGKFTPTVTLTASANPSPLGAAVSFTATVSNLSGAPAPTGTVSFNVDGATQSTPALASGTASWTASALAAGDYAITAVYSGDTNSRTVTSSVLNQVVSPPGLNISLGATADVECDTNGSTTTVYTAYPPAGTLIYPGMANDTGNELTCTGAFKFELSSVPGSIVSAKLRVRVDIGGPIFSAPFNLIFSGSTDDSWGDTSGSETAPAPASTVTPSIKSVSSGALVAGDWVEVNVTSFVQAQMAGDKVASFVVSTDATNSNNYVGLYSRESADPTYRPELAIVYQLAPTVTTLAASGISTAGATLAGTVNANGASAIATFDYGLTTAYGTAVAATPGTVLAGAGSTSVSATLSGLTTNTVYHFRAKGTNAIGTTNGSDLTFTTVPELPTGVTATAGNAQASVSFTAPTGTATITSYTVTSSSGQTASGLASPINVTGLINGTAYTFTVRATNAGGTSSPSAASASVTPMGTTTTTVASSPNPSTYGTSVTFTATVMPSTATGTVTFKDGSTTLGTGTLSGGTATFSTSSLLLSSHSISAIYPGDMAYTSSTSSTLTQTVNQVATITTVASNLNPSTYGTSVTFTATVSPSTATGTVTFKDSTSGTTLGTGTLSGGTATYSTSSLSVGNYGVDAIYGGNTNYTASTSSRLTQVVNQASSTTTMVSNLNPSTYGASVTFTATVMPSTATGTVTFKDSTSGTTLGTGTLSGGTATYSTSALTTGSHSVFAVYAGDTNYTTSTSSTTNQTVNAVAPGAPTIGTAIASDAQASVTFIAPASNGGATITGYTVTSSPGGKTGTGSASPITVTGLTNGTGYTFTVTATNSASLTGLPSALSNSVIPKGTQTITFASPGAQNFGTTPTLTATSSSGLTVTFSSNNTSVATITTGGVLTFLTTGTASITAQQAGNGTYAAAPDVTRAFVVNAVVPGAPTIGTATAGNAQAIVMFTAPIFAGSAALTSYTVTSNPGGITATGSASPLTVTGLTNGTAYTFTVTATNSASLTSAPSAASNEVTPSADTTPPTIGVPTFSNLGAGQVTLSLTSSETGTGYVTILSTPETAGDATQTKAGQNGAGASTRRHGSLSLTAGAPGTYRVRNLAAETTYTVVFTAKDVAGNLAPVQTATFTTLAVRALAGMGWNTVFPAGFSAGRADNPSLALGADGTPYVAYRDDDNGSRATVKKFNGANWVLVGTAGFSAGGAYNPSLALAADGTPYVAYTDDHNGSEATVLKYNGMNWEPVGIAGFSAGGAYSPSLALAADGTPYVAYQDNGNNGAATVMKFNGTNWVSVGAAGFSAGGAYSPSLALAADGMPYIAYRDYGNVSKATVMKYDGSAWVPVGTAGFSIGEAFYTSLALAADGTPYVAYMDRYNGYKMTVMEFTGTNWVPVGTAGFSAGEADNPSLALGADGTPYVAYMDAYNGGAATVMKYNGTNWEPVSTAGFSAGESYNPSLALGADGTPYVAYMDAANSNMATVMKLTPTVTSVAVPAAGTYGIGANLIFTANYSSPVTVAGTPTLPLTIGSLTRVASYDVAHSTSTALAFTFTVGAGDLDTDGIVVGSALSLNGGTLNGSDGYPALLALHAIGSTTGVLIDGVAPATPTLAAIAGAQASGTAEAGSTIKIYDGVTLVATTITAGDGTWRVTLPDGSYASLTVAASDTAGNTATSSAIAQTVDGTPPAITSTLTASGTYGTDFSYAPTATDANGLRNYPPPYTAESLPSWLIIDNYAGTIFGKPIEVGTFPITLNVYDAYGNKGTATLTLTVGKATQTVSLYPISDKTYDPNSTSTVYLNSYTSSTLPATYKVDGPATLGYDASYGLSYLTLTGTGTVKVTTSQAGNANYLPAIDVVQSFTVKPLATVTLSNQQTTVTYDGQPHGVTVTTDPAGLAVVTEYYSMGKYTLSAMAIEGAVAEAMKIDPTIPPTAVGNYEVDAWVDDGTYLGDDYGFLTIIPATPTTPATITNNTTPVLSGIADPGSAVNVYDGTTLLGSTTASAAAEGSTTGTWTFTPTTALTEGVHSITITEPSTLVIKKATVLPTVDEEAMQDTATADTEAAVPIKAVAAKIDLTPLVSAALTLTIDTTAPVAPSVTSITPAGVSGTAEAGSTIQVYDGTMLLGTTTAGSDGTWSLPVPLLDGTHGITATATDSAGNSTTSPSATSVTIDATAPSAPVITTTSGFTADNKPPITGTAETSATVKLYDGATLLATLTADATTGGWSFTPITALADGAHTITATATDAAGNTSVASAALALVVDTTVPTAPAITSITPTGVSGTAEAGSTVQVYDGTTLLGTTTAGSDGTWTLPVSLLDGAHGITATATDSAGNSTTSPSATSVTFDTTAPTAPVITTVSGFSANAKPTITGTAETSATVKLYDGATLLATLTADATTGGWSFTPIAALADGAHTITATATDAAGNTSSASSALSMNIDTTVPSAPAITTASGNTTVKTPTLAGTAEASATVKLYDGATLLGTVTADGTGAWSLLLTTALGEGTHALNATATDAAGNVSAASTACTLTVGTAPTITAAPAAKAVVAGSAATLTVTAAGTETLSYEWQRSIDGTNYTALAGGTTTSYALASSTVANSGSYRVVVSNAFGSVTSSAAYLSVTPVFTAAKPDGYASATTGGATGTSVVVLTAADFKTQATSASACTITVVGQLSVGTVSVASNKTIQGADADAALVGNLNLSNVSNVIIRGLNLTNPGTTIVSGAYTNGGDALTVSGSSKVFVTHCTFFDCADHDIKIVSGSDNVTVSWCEFYASAATLLHRYGVQIGSTTETQPQHVTLHHNWWSSNLEQRMPSSNYGYVHQYNNYLASAGDTTGSVASDHAQFLSERNVYTGMVSPLIKQEASAIIVGFTAGKIRTIGNVYTTCTGTTPDAGTDTVFTPAYSYELLPASDVATEVAASAGNIAGAATTDVAPGTATITGPTAAVTPGASFTLTAVPTGFTAATYQWRLNNIEIAGATASTYTSANTQAANAGTYTVAISLASGDTVVSTPLAVSLGSAQETSKVSGGGSVGAWFYAVLALLGTARFLRRSGSSRTTVRD